MRGTGRTDGLVEDVYISGSGNSLVTAKSCGQVGGLRTVSSNNVNDLITIQKSYIQATDNNSLSFNWPLSNQNFRLEVERYGTTVLQRAIQLNGVSWQRYSFDTGSTWGSWRNIAGYYYNGTVNIYISKDGDDNNTGLYADKPIKTLTRVYEVISNSTGTATVLRFGEGDWGNLSILSEYNLGTLHISNFTNAVNGVTPRFNKITSHGVHLELHNIDVNSVEIGNQYCHVKNSTFGTFYVSFGSTLNIDSGNTIKSLSGTDFENYNVFDLAYNGHLSIANTTLTLSNDLTQPTFIFARYGRSTCEIHGYTVFANYDNYSGYKFQTNNGYIDFVGKHFNYIPGVLDETQTYSSINGTPAYIRDIITFKSDSQYGQNIWFTTTRYKRGTITSGTYYNAQLLFCDNQGKNIGDRTGCIVSAEDSVASYITMVVYKPESGHADTSDNSSILLQYNKAGSKDAIFNCNAIPRVNNTFNLGDSNGKWANIYAETSTISTSDERIKSNIDNIPDSVLDAWEEVNWQQYQFKDAVEKKGNNARLHTGTVAQRILSVFTKHGLDTTRYGLLCHDSWESSDEEEKIIDKEAVTESRKIVDKEAVYETMTVIDIPEYTDEEGVKHDAITHEETIEVSPEEYHMEEVVIEPEVSHIVKTHRDAGDLYSLRYEECFAVEAAYQRRRADRIEARLAALEKKIK